MLEELLFPGQLIVVVCVFDAIRDILQKESTRFDTNELCWLQKGQNSRNSLVRVYWAIVTQ